VSSMLQCGAMCCSMLRCVAACFRVLQRCDSERSREHCPRTYTYTTRLSLALATCLISLLYPLLSHANALEHTRIQLLIHVYNSSISCSHDICNLCVLSPSLTRKCARTNTYTTPLSLAFTISIIFLLYPVLSNAKALAHTHIQLLIHVYNSSISCSHDIFNLCVLSPSLTRKCARKHVHNSSISCFYNFYYFFALPCALTRKCTCTYTYTTPLFLALATILISWLCLLLSHANALAHTRIQLFYLLLLRLHYGVATISRLLKIIVVFCRILSLL